MNFLEKVKADFIDQRNSRGRMETVTVSYNELGELIRHYETLNSYERATHEEANAQHINHQLHDTIRACYHQQGQSAEKVLMVVMDTLRLLWKNGRR